MSDSPLVIAFQHQVLDATADDPSEIRISKVVKPCLVNMLDPGAKLLEGGFSDAASQEAYTNLQKAIDSLLHVKGHVFQSQPEESVLDKLRNLISEKTLFTEAGLKAVKATTVILEELVLGSYSDRAVLEYANASALVLYNHLHGGANFVQKKVNEFCARVLQEGHITVHSRAKEDCNNSSFRIKDTKTTIALLKQPRNIYDASHKNVIENFPLYHTPTHELVGYESDVLLGFNHVPITIQVTCLNTREGIVQEKQSTLQEFVLHAKPFGSYGLLHKGGGEFLRSLDKSLAHMAALSGILKGFAAGHINNYVVQEKSGVLFEIDLKECMVPFNRMPASFKVKRVVDGKVYCEDLDEKARELEGAPVTRPELHEINRRRENERKAIVMARLSILGLPQNEKPFEKAALLFILHPSLPVLMEAHHDSIRRKDYEIPASALAAQTERLEALRKYAKDALAKDSITLTPRECYFQIFGGRELYDIARQKNYFPMTIFNNIVGAAQRHEYTDLSRPETLKERIIGKPSNNSKEARQVFENLQMLYSGESPNISR